jgi:hypothetical protein
MPCRTRMISIAVTILLCCTPELLFAAAGQNAAPQDEQAASAQKSSAPASEAGVASTIPDAPQAQGQPNSTAPSNSTDGRNAVAGQQEPEGTAAARAARTIGGPASKPAGSAIAPAKQRQVRSLLIKIGAIAGAGVALGTVYALTRGTPSKPPGAH